MWVDSHCHLDHSKFTPENGLGGVLAECKIKGIEGILSINCQIRDEFPALLKLVQPLDNVWCTVGTHPHEASRDDEKSVTLDELIQLAASNPKVIGIGECGLDYFYKNASIEDQHTCFRKHIQACLAVDKPIIIHAREADHDIIRLLREETSGQGMRGIMHCFSSSSEMGYEALELGLHISFSGILTFKKSEELRSFAKEVPLDKVLVETDSPYLAPEPYRGQMNVPSYLPFTGAVLADLKGVSAIEMARITTANFYKLFGLNNK